MWPGGVTFGVIGSSFFGNVSNCWLNNYGKFGASFFLYLRKTWGGADNRPPGRARVKTAPVAAIPVNSYFRSKSAEHDVTLTSFVAELWYPGLLNFNIMCKIVGIEGTASLVVIPALVWNISQEKRGPRNSPPVGRGLMSGREIPASNCTYLQVTTKYRGTKTTLMWGGGQTSPRVQGNPYPKLKTPQIWPNIFGKEPSSRDCQK